MFNHPCSKHIFKTPHKYAAHDDVMNWKNFPRYWPFARGIHRSPVNSPHKGQWRGALMFSLICVWISGWVYNREAGDLRRHCAHYDVILMGYFYLINIQCFQCKCSFQLLLIFYYHLCPDVNAQKFTWFRRFTLNHIPRIQCDFFHKWWYMFDGIRWFRITHSSQEICNIHILAITAFITK